MITASYYTSDVCTSLKSTCVAVNTPLVVDVKTSRLTASKANVNTATASYDKHGNHYVYLFIYNIYLNMIILYTIYSIPQENADEVVPKVLEIHQISFFIHDYLFLFQRGICFHCTIT